MSRFDDLAVTWDIAPMHLDRTLDVAARLRELPIAGRSALEVGAGTGLLSFALADVLGEVTATDPSEGMVAELQRKIAAAGTSTVRAVRCGDDLEAVPGPFGVVMLQMALHHVPEVEPFLARAFERLEVGGLLAIADLDAEDGSFHGHDVRDVHFGFDRESLRAQLVATGFVQVEFHTVHVMRRETAAGSREFPIFLATARRP